MSEAAGIAGVLDGVLVGRCARCLRPLATEEHWATTKGGERPDLCWEPYDCPWEPKISATELQAAAVLDHLRATFDRLVAAEAAVARVAALADEWGHRYDSGDHMLGCPDGTGYYDLLAYELRAALGGDGGGMGPETSQEGPRSDREGQGRMSGHLGERQDGSGER